MTDQSATDRKLVGILLGQGLLTPNQAARIEKALERGVPIAEAIRTVPLIDFLDFYRAQNLLSQQSGTLPPSLRRPGSGLVPMAFGRQGAADMIRDEDGTAAIEIDEEAPPPPYLSHLDEQELARRHLKRRQQAALESNRAEVQAVDPRLPLESITEQGLEFSHGDLDFQKLRTSDVTYDLNDDDGVLLVGELNGMLESAILNSMGALQFSHMKGMASVADYNFGGHRLGVRHAELPFVQKATARLKIMARLSPWKTEPQLGGFLLKRKHIFFSAVLHTQSIEDGERTTVYLREQMEA